MPHRASTAQVFAEAMAEKDAVRLRALMHPRVDFKAMTPGKFWEANDRDEVLKIFFGHWFPEHDRIESLDRVETDAFADRQRVGYRMSVATGDGPTVVEQQAYLTAQNNKIVWLRVMCSGNRPPDGSDESDVALS
jgi:hypothetical protein